MPGMDGLQLLGEIKQRFPDLPVMMVTAYGDDARRRQATEYGADKWGRVQLAALVTNMDKDARCSGSQPRIARSSPEPPQAAYPSHRRVAGGLTRERQEQILAPELDAIRTRKKLVPELIRLAGSLERIPKETKTELANLFIGIASDLAREKKHCAPYLGALGHILSRAPLYAGPETVLSPDVVERAYESFRTRDWTTPELAEMQTLFLRAARVVGSRSFDLPKALRHRIATKLENSGVAPQKTGKVKEFIPLGSSERISLHDESLPPGLILTES
jgi:hypothetical protein